MFDVLPQLVANDGRRGLPAATPAIAIAYAVDGTTINFTVETRTPCTARVCLEQVAWARETFGLGRWDRT